jgi:hypothetical protein
MINHSIHNKTESRMYVLEYGCYIFGNVLGGRFATVKMKAVQVQEN